MSKFELTPINQMISMHATNNLEKKNWITSQIFLYNADNIYVYKLPFRQFSKMCNAKPGILNNRTTFQYLKDNAEYIKVEELIQRKNNIYNYRHNYIDNK